MSIRAQPLLHPLSRSVGILTIVHWLADSDLYARYPGDAVLGSHSALGCWPHPCSWLLRAEHKPLSEVFSGKNDKFWGHIKWFSKLCTEIN